MGKFKTEEVDTTSSFGTELETVVTETKEKKVQTEEDVKILKAGVEALVKMGASDKLQKLLLLVPAWNGDKDALPSIKEQVIESFGDVATLKDYMDADFSTDILPFLGIAKSIPVLNNIKSFYARRESAGKVKVKMQQVAFGGKLYMVSSDYYQEVSAFSGAERRQLLLAHPATTLVEVEELI